MNTEKIIWLAHLVGYLHLGAALLTAVLAGTMGEMPGRSMPYPARIRYTQGALAVALLAAGYCWLARPECIPVATAAWLAVVMLQTSLILRMSLVHLRTRNERVAFWRRAAPFALIVALIGIVEVNISRHIDRIDRSGNKQVNGQKTDTTQVDTLLTNSTR